MSGVEAILFVIAWVIPLGALVFVVSSLWQILRGMSEIKTELTRIREALERDGHP